MTSYEFGRIIERDLLVNPLSAILLKNKGRDIKKYQITLQIISFLIMHYLCQ
ncbi:hypothetical protein PITCH_A840050 [uncultured Desulfobacterium sp.]|uniref:Uncharacterized protein n=1 Tax=uncultured Desulfobacterium sp. TaxID=201089 RepID=A0A445N394_9BACT|nr:hypothetical protein PITCH_A840050 [uncultured Desulfobacterium sp.]